MTGHSGHSTFLKNCLENNIIDSKRIEAYKVNNRENAVSTVSKPTQKVLNKQPTDYRLNSEKFRQDVRVVLDFLCLDNNMRNFKKLDKKHGSDTPVDWEIFARNIRQPKHEAIVDILCRKETTGKMVCLTLPGVTKSEAMKNLETEQYKFVRWW